MPPPTLSQSFESARPRLDATARLLVLLAKTDLTDRQREAARRLASQVDDWNEFADIAGRKFASPFVHRHLRACAADIVPEAVMTRMRGLARASTLSTLRVAAALAAFHRVAIRPSNARHAYIKGVALSQQYRRNVGERFSRDIDVLVADEAFPKVLEAAIAAGYRVLVQQDPPNYTTDRADIRFLAKHADVVTLIGADSIPVEVHRRLDKLSLKFDLEDAFSSADDVALPGANVKVLSKPLHFVYVCYHHSRHFWSHLHWLADIDSMIRDPECDRDEIGKLADSVGITPTVEASFELQELVSDTESWSEDTLHASRGGQFLKAGLVNLDGDLELEEQLRENMTLSDFMSAWQVSPGRYKWLRVNSLMKRLRPDVSQYFDHRYPHALHWIYSLENAVSLAKNVALRTTSLVIGLPRRMFSSPDPSNGKPQ